MIQVLRAKLHCIRVTGARLDYHGSITLDPEFCWRAGINPLEFVDIWNKNSGARLSTYVLFGRPGSRMCTMNGAAARTCQVGDELIIAASTYIAEPDLVNIEPKVLIFGPDNRVIEARSHKVTKDRKGRPQLKTRKLRG